MVSARLNMIMVTSWNEWKEATAIEPSDESAELFLHVISGIILEYQFPLAISFIIGVFVAFATFAKKRIPK